MLSVLIPTTPGPLLNRPTHTFGRNPHRASATRLCRWSDEVATEKSAVIPPSTLVRCAPTAILQMGSALGRGPNSILIAARVWLRLKSTACVTVAAHESSRAGSAPSRGLEFAKRNAGRGGWRDVTPDGSIMFRQTMPKRCLLPRAIRWQGFSTAVDNSHSWSQSLCLTSSLG